MNLLACGLLVTLLALACPQPLQAGLVEVIQASGSAHTGRHLLAPNECVSKGLQGTCNGCVCCCYTGGAGIVSYQPTDTCTCARNVETSQIWATVILSVILVAGALLVQLYFANSLPISPYPRREQLQPQGSRRPTVGRMPTQQQGQYPPAAPPLVPHPPPYQAPSAYQPPPSLI